MFIASVLKLYAFGRMFFLERGLMRVANSTQEWRWCSHHQNNKKDVLPGFPHGRWGRESD